MEKKKEISLKRRIFDIIQIGNKSDFSSRAFDLFLAVVIILNIAVMFLQTFEELTPIFPIMHVIEVVTIWIFVVEYVLRIWTADFLYPGKTYGKAIGKFLISYDGVVELLTILPFFFLSGFVAFRILRVVRIFHLFRINAKYDSFSVITTVLKEKRSQIGSSIIILVILMMASSIGMYAAEHEAQPEAFRNAFSGIWWSVSALLTVGYGDIYPITVAGKIMAIITAFLGVGVVAIPTGIISAGFVEQYTRLKHITTVGGETAFRFVTILIGKTHSWRNLLIKDTNLPEGLTLALILRQDEVIVPRGDVEILENDRVVLAAEAYADELGIALKEVTVRENHPWAGHRIAELDISRQTTILTVRHKNKLIIPTGQTVIHMGDHVILFTKHHETALPEAHEIRI